MINNNNNILPYFRKEKSTLVTISAVAIALLLLASPLVFSKNILLQRVQATTLVPTSVQTDSPVKLGTLCSSAADTALTFEAQGTPSSSDPSSAIVTNGTFQITDSSSGQTLWSGNFDTGHGSITDEPGPGWDVDITYRGDGQGSVCGNGGYLEIQTSCPGGDGTNIALYNAEDAPIGTISGTVDCDTGGDTTAQPSTTLTGTTTTQDSDSDGIPDSSDNCPHNSHHRCYKEGGTSSTTAQQQPSSNRTGNQTR